MEFKDNLQIIRVFRGKKKADVAKCLGIGRQNLTNWEAGPVEPGTEILDKLSNCLQVPRELFYKKDLTKEYLEKNHSSENTTPDDKMNDNTEKARTAQELFKELIDKDSEYRVIPKSILNEEYRIILKSELDDIKVMRDALIEANKITLQAKQDVIDQLKKEIASMNDRSVTHPQQTQ